MKIHPDFSDLGKTSLLLSVLFTGHFLPWMKHPSLYSSSFGESYSISLIVFDVHLPLFQTFCAKPCMNFESRGSQHMGLLEQNPTVDAGMAEQGSLFSSLLQSQ